MIQTGIVFNVIGILLILLGCFMMIPMIYALLFEPEGWTALLYSGVISAFTGSVLWYRSRNSSKAIGKREGFLIVALGWLAIGIFSGLPFLFCHHLSMPVDAVFESVSGLTTTGASVLQDIETVPHSILLWRSLTQWIGGMGIIVLTVAIFPLLGIGGVELFVAEAPGPATDKIHPRIKDTAKRLWLIYVALTASLGIILVLCGMTSFEAVNHALTTMATGGFSTKNASIAHFSNPYIHWWITLFMAIAGVNYTVIYYMLKGRFRKAWRSDEFKTYLLVVLLVSSAVGLSLWHLTGEDAIVSMRIAFFQVISIITTTGFVLADYTSWSHGLTFTFFVLMFIGACAGSTSGGIKIIRHLVLLKNALLETKRLLHPKAIIRIKIDREIVKPRILTHILVFLLFYLLLFLVGSFLMILVMHGFEDRFLTSIGAVATALGNVGPAIAELGPMDNFAAVPATGKWILIILMLLGRLELFTIIILFTPYFWRKN